MTSYIDPENEPFVAPQVKVIYPNHAYVLASLLSIPEQVRMLHSIATRSRNERCNPPRITSLKDINWKSTTASSKSVWTHLPPSDHRRVGLRELLRQDDSFKKLNVKKLVTISNWQDDDLPIDDCWFYATQDACRAISPHESSGQYQWFFPANVEATLFTGSKGRARVLSDDKQFPGWTLVISIGCTAKWAIRRNSQNSTLTPITMRSGDAILFNSSNRAGIELVDLGKTHPDTSPTNLVELNSQFSFSRMSIEIRQYSKSQGAHFARMLRRTYEVARRRLTRIERQKQEEHIRLAHIRHLARMKKSSHESKSEGTSRQSSEGGFH